MRRYLLPAALAVVVTVAAVVVVLLALPGDRVGVTAPEVTVSTSPPPTEAPVPLADVVTTSSGRVRGVTDGSVRSWLGLPYAAPPTGRLRWRPPQPVDPWRRVRDASAFGASCVQPKSYDFGARTLTQRPESSEDCLFLNVARPDDDARGLPVVVWLHGGGFFAGNGGTAISEGSALVQRGIVLVSVNYRLGRLGFFAHPALRERVANFGLLDQIAALQWVRDNAEAFGGDAGNVTLAGGSAGAMSVNALMSAPVADGLYERAIAESAPSDERSLTLSEARDRGAAAFPRLSPAELRALPSERLLSSTFNTLSGDAPIIDAVLPASSSRAFADGTEARVPYLTGTTADEFSDDDYRSFGVDPEALRASLGGDGNATLEAAYGDTFAADVLDDLIFDLPAVERAVSHGRRAPTYRYVFRASGYSGHGAEGAYVFDTVSGGRDGRLSDAVADYWVAFARTGRPDVSGLPAWPEAAESAYLVLEPDGPTPHDTDVGLTRLGALRLALS
ncbi:carboxylesterase/lipase family protein [Nocardioides sp.]|uniref:carboxylesterase/lipase family protein n=1 Tax=Nocardioides sp. TaxID=35761 RepID=UPI002726884A|nr:carboxylesterase family protein [Nocardioides sp.]MDO9457443.1 carboxylesterase family protein [Nocardioides sp.]